MSDSTANLDDVLSQPNDDVTSVPNEVADPHDLVAQKVPADILAKYEVYSYRNAAVILSETRRTEFDDVLEALRNFSITCDQIRRAGGNESDIPKLLSASLRPKGWHETIVQGDLVVKLRWKEQVGSRNNKPIFKARTLERVREKYLDGHKIDYVKDRVAFDLEWNSKDQTFDRDLYAFSAFSACGVIDAAVLVTRSAELNAVFRSLGQSFSRTGEPEVKRDGSPRMIHEKYGASTTWMGKLLYRLNAGRNGGCPVLAVGIKPTCISDWKAHE
jgi:hypothetical protein